MIVITTHTNADFDSLASMVPASRMALFPGGLGRPLGRLLSTRVGGAQEAWRPDARRGEEIRVVLL